jgi:(2Fe-2S) ferredoxin
MAIAKFDVLVCAGTGCRASMSDNIIANFKSELTKKGVSDEVQVIGTGCFGFCEKGPIVKIMPDNTFYVEVKPEDVTEIVNEHIIKGRKVKRLLYDDPRKKEHISDTTKMDFYKKQLRVALRNCGFINPENIEESIARDAGWWRFSNRYEMGYCRKKSRPKICGLQCRRGRPGSFHGSVNSRGRPAFGNRSNGYLRLLHWSYQRVGLHSCRISLGH